MKRILSLLLALLATSAMGADLRSAGIKGATTSTPCTGCVGEKITFTGQTVSAVTTGYTASGTPLATLSTGTWLVLGQVVTVVVGGSASGAFGFISTNGVSDGTGAIGDGDITTFYDAGQAAQLPMIAELITVSSSTAIYAKAKAVGAGRSIGVYGFAVRIY